MAEIASVQQMHSFGPVKPIDLGPQNLLNVLGYCPCDLNSLSEALPKTDLTFGEVAGNKDGDKKIEGSYHSNTKSACDKEPCAHCGADVELKDSSNSHQHRKGDEKLLETHPNEIKYFTNPKTGRKVKKIVCKVPG